MMRLHDWLPRLRRYLADVSHRPVEPGAFDCCLFGAGGVEAQTGVDLAVRWRGRYSTFAGGRRILRKGGFDDHAALIAAELPEVPRSFAGVGDIAIVPSDEGPAVGIVQGEAVYALGLDGRFQLVPRVAAARFFKVGDIVCHR